MENKDKQSGLFGDKFMEAEWKREWQNMPEFIQEDLKPFQQIIISFMFSEDVEEFSKLINQSTTSITKSLWFPNMNRIAPIDYLYIHKDNLDKIKKMCKSYES